MKILDKIDFNNLPKDFKEQDVREEIITPILKKLGYSSFDENNLIKRETKLKHPYTRFGSEYKKASQFPDYIIKVDKKTAFTIEAKSPKEDITKGKNVEQAYSYAININVKAKRFVLCNGKEINIFDVDKNEPLAHIKLTNLEENWEQIYKLLSPTAFRNPHIFNFKADFGLWCLKNGIGCETKQEFKNCYINDVARLEDNLFTIIAVIEKEGKEYLASFDFERSIFEDFMKQVPNQLKEKVRSYIMKSPFKYQTESAEESFKLNFRAHLSNKIIKNENEEYIPLKIDEFID